MPSSPGRSRRGGRVEPVDVASFLRTDPLALAHRLAWQDQQRHRRNEAQQLRAWTVTLDVLRVSLARVVTQAPAAGMWRLALEFPLHRLGRRIDAVLVTPRAVLVLEFKAGATRHAAEDRVQVDDYALDLRDFHAGSRRHPIVPILVATEAQAPAAQIPLLLEAVAPVLDASSASLAGLLLDLWAHLPVTGPALDVAGWERAPYRPVPGIVEAACTLYATNSVAEIAAARADATNLTLTTQAILQAVRRAREERRFVALFVTGIPGAGKTLCGLNAVFGVDRSDDATYLTGNPTLVHVLREALARDAAAGGGSLRAARQRTEKAIQALPRFRDHHVRGDEVPAERVVVIDEAQRAWSRDHAVRKSTDREVRLSDSEAGHLLDVMARHQGWAVVVCLVGGGQEIHDGEGGLAEWGAALLARPCWQVLAAPDALTAPDARQRLPDVPGLRTDPALHLAVALRNLRNAAVAPWVDAVLRGDAETARAIAGEDAALPFRLTRDLAAMRRHLREAARGTRRAGLLASAGAKRLRADGLGVELAHMDAAAVAHWFLDRWPGDVRAAGSLEVVGTEFSVQGLELDHTGLCWGGDLLREPGHAAWRVRAFVGTRWQAVHGKEARDNRLNAYRVLLTRARQATIIFVPRGDADDPTRAPAEMDAVADFLARCGVPGLEASPAFAPRIPAPMAMLL
jgi:hypothetical protein